MGHGQDGYKHPAAAQRGPTGAPLANDRGKWWLQLTEDVPPLRPDKAPTCSSLAWLPEGFSLCSPARKAARPRGQAHVKGRLSCVPVTPFCHWDVNAANGGANYLLAMAPLRAKPLTHDGEEASPYSYLIITWIAHTSMFKPRLSARLQSRAAALHHWTPLSPQKPSHLHQGLGGDVGKKERKRVFFFCCIDNT